jgi:hypothetical protein
MDVRPAQDSELDAQAQRWFDAWQDGHAAVGPVEPPRRRTPAESRTRLAVLLPLVRAEGPPGAPLGSSAHLTTDPTGQSEYARHDASEWPARNHTRSRDTHARPRLTGHFVAGTSHKFR